MSVASHRRIRAPSKSTKRLTLQSLREFAVAWSTAGYAFAFSPRSFSPLSSLPFYPVTVDDSGKRHPVPRPLLLLWQRVWISSALFHPRRTYFNDSRRRERERESRLMPRHNSEYAAGWLNRSFTSIGIPPLPGREREAAKGRSGRRKGTDNGFTFFFFLWWRIFLKGYAQK